MHTNLQLSARNAGSIIDDDRIVGVAFTGSNRGGAAVGEQAGRNVKKTVMELGGVDPFIVLDDADMDATLERFLFAKLHATGQICIAAKRIILVESIAQEFIDRAKGRFAALTPGDPLDENTGYGPVCNEKAAVDLERQITESVKAGAKILVGGKRDGAFIEPTNMTDIPKGSPADVEELFGPVALVHIVKDEDEAIRVANDSDFGLCSSVWTTEAERAVRIARRLEAGYTYLNGHGPMAQDGRGPFGGFKQSGIGRNLGYDGVLAFAEPHSISAPAGFLLGSQN